MIEFNAEYEAIFDAGNIDDECTRIAKLMEPVGVLIKEALEAGLYERAVTMYLQLLKSMTNHFVEDEHWCWFDDWYCPDYELRTICQQIKKYDIGEAAQQLLDAGHDEIRQTECYDNYGLPSYVR